MQRKTIEKEVNAHKIKANEAKILTNHHLSSESGILHWRVCTMICGINYNLIVRLFNERMNRM